ncbi:rRNA maturation RNase YbeY [Solimicrobium silvestre]|uniref:Endoribonuclease YbeY n=1 Tax=Solimicrobium silvestre TaxID=2099400 RepID=A0A2S9H2I6_9BURK|nr:rRNA maturation RNase YbeY [Solimicrobium silvestre]PRC94189.1 rRNA maturation factor YbeY [Solimicrobium silvestre]
MAEKFKLKLTLQFPDKRLQKQLTKALLKSAVQAALFAPAELTLRFVDAVEGKTLNREYRGKDYATNVLTFAYTEDMDAETTQADIILCTDVLQQEASAQHKSITDHALHLIVHGVLHAQGYDHEDEEEAVEMEGLEAEILATLGVDNPYAGEDR